MKAFYADASNDSQCNGKLELDCKKDHACGWDPTTEQTLCGSSCCGIVTKNETAGTDLANDGIGKWADMHEITDTRANWASSCEYLARNTVYNYDFTACYTSGADIRTGQRYMAAKSTLNMCDTTDDVDCSSVCDCPDSGDCRNVNCELLNLSVMGTAKQAELESLGLSGVLSQIQGFVSTDSIYLAALLAIVAALKRKKVPDNEIVRFARQYISEKEKIPLGSQFASYQEGQMSGDLI
jgi:hypothetical protein